MFFVFLHWCKYQCIFILVLSYYMKQRKQCPFLLVHDANKSHEICQQQPNTIRNLQYHFWLLSTFMLIWQKFKSEHRLCGYKGWIINFNNYLNVFVNVIYTFCCIWFWQTMENDILTVFYYFGRCSFPSQYHQFLQRSKWRIVYTLNCFIIIFLQQLISNSFNCSWTWWLRVCELASYETYINDKFSFFKTFESFHSII